MGAARGRGEPSPDDTVVANNRRYLDGVGAPGGPAKFGTALAPDSSAPGAKGQTEPPVNGRDEWPGGVWFEVNGWLTWAFGRSTARFRGR